MGGLVGQDRKCVWILIPVFNDWRSLRRLLVELHDKVHGRPEVFHVLVVDDASTEDICVETDWQPFRDVFSSLNLLRLKCNLGHQRAIAIGLAWVYHNCAAEAVLVMDGDGEDRPEDVPVLLDALARNGAANAVFAARHRRSESITFRFFYALYRVSHRLLTGIPVKIGNFSVLPRRHLDAILVSNYLWNHYAATVVHLRLPIEVLPTIRGTRYDGVSKMNFVALVRHGLSALAVHSESVAVRLLIAAGCLATAGIGLLCLVPLLRLFAHVSVPYWIPYIGGFLLISLLQVLPIAFSFALHILADFNTMSFLPTRDYAFFVDRYTQLARDESRYQVVHSVTQR